MHPPHFTWDPRKDAANQRKHGVSFAEAQTVFSDEAGLLLDDPDFTETEDDRYVLLGLSARTRLLLVVHCYRADDNEIRVISARRATRTEARQYVARGS